MILYLIYEIVLKLNSLDELKTEYIRSQLLFSLIIHTLRLSKDDKKCMNCRGKSINVK